MYIQPSAVTVFLAHLGILLVCRRKQATPRLAGAAVAVAAFVILIAPWTIRNRVVMGSWMFMRDDLGLELHVANRDHASASMEALFSSTGYCDVVLNCGSLSPRLVEDRKLGEIEFYRRDLRQAVSWIESHPGAFLRLTLQRMGYFWFDMPLHPINFISRSIVLILGLTGVGLMWRRGMRISAALFLAVLVVFPLPYYLVVYSNRYVVPMSFALLLPAGFSLSTIQAKTVSWSVQVRASIRQ